MRPDRRHIPDPGRRASITPRSWWGLRVPLGIGLVALLLNWSGLTLPQPSTADVMTAHSPEWVGQGGVAAPRCIGYASNIAAEPSVVQWCIDTTYRQ